MAEPPFCSVGQVVARSAAIAAEDYIFYARILREFSCILSPNGLYFIGTRSYK